jgi:hypothetical protein
MFNERSYCDDMCNHLKIGESIVFDHHIFQKAYVSGWPSIYNTSIEAFLSSKIGSAWGCWTCIQDIVTGDYIVSHHEESDKRVYCDPDRQHLFKKDKDGYLIPR